MSTTIRPSLRLLIFLVLASLTLVACAGAQANENWPGLSADDQFVYVSYGPGIVAYDVIEEREAWKYSPAESSAPIFAPPSVQDGRIVVGDYGQAGGLFSPGNKYNLNGLTVADQKAIAEEWILSDAVNDRYVGAALQVGDVAYVPNSDFVLLAVDTTTGEELWRFETEEGAVWGQPTVHEGVLYITSLDRHAYALNADTGELIWSREVAGAVSAKALVNPDANLLYVPSFDNQLHALNLDDGQEVWSAEATNWVWNAPAFHDDVLYYADSNGEVFAVSATTGESIWQTTVHGMKVAEGIVYDPPTEIRGAIQASPVYANETIYIASVGNEETEEGLIVALSAETGEEIWQQTTPAPLFATPVVVGDVVVVGLHGEEGELLIGYDLESGDKAWTYNQPES